MTIAKTIMNTACTVAGEDVSGKYGPLITDALDALTDALAGENVQGAQTIADAFAILGEHLDDNAPSGKIIITENGTDIDVAQYATADVSVSGGASLGNTVIVQAGEIIEDFSFEIWLNDQYVCVMGYVDTEGVTIAAGVTIVINHGANASATIKIGDADPVAMYDDAEIQAFMYTIPADMGTDTRIIIEGTGF